MRLAGMKRSTRVFGDRILRSKKRFNETRYELEAKKIKKMLPVDVVDIQENNVKVVDHRFGLVAEFEGNRRYNRCRKVGNFNESDEGMGNIDKKELFVENLNGNGADGDMEIDGEKEEVIKLGEFKDVSLVDDYVSRVKRFENVYTRKRKRNVVTDSSLKSSSFDENCGSDKKYVKYYRKKKKVRVSLDTGFDGKDVTRKRPFVFASSSSGVYQFSCFVTSVLTYLRKAKVFSWRRFSSFLLLEPAASIYQSNGTRLLLDSTFFKRNSLFKVFGSINSIPFFTVNFSSVPSCFLYMHSNLLLKFAFLSNAFLKLQIAENVTSDEINVQPIDTARSIYHLDKCMVAKKPRSAVKRVPRGSGVKGYSPRKAFVNDSSQRKAFVNASSQRKAFVNDSSQRKVFVNDSSKKKTLVNNSSQRKALVRKKVLGLSRVNNSSQRKVPAIKRVLRVSRVDKTSQRKELVNDSSQSKEHVNDSTPVKVLKDESLVNKLRDIVEGVVPVPVIKEVEGYEAVEYVPFLQPESYISSKSDEVTPTLGKSYPVYDMDSDDEKWLKKLSSKHFEVSEDIFEKAVGAFERGIYRSPNGYSDAASAIDRCLDIASKGVLEDVYRYWMTKRKKKLSSRVRLGVFQCNKPHKVESATRNTADRKKRASRRLASKRAAQKQPVFKKANMSDEKVLKDTKRAYINVHEAQEAARRSEEAAIAKRNEAQALMEIADLASYRATMALRIADALAAGGPVDNPAGDPFSFLC